MTRQRVAAILMIAVVSAAACSAINAPDDPIDPDDDTGGNTTGGSGGSDSCGDGTVDTGETCDGDCPTSCDDNDTCTDDILQGSADTCNVVCVNTDITICDATADGCCPSSCDGTNDADCAMCGNNVVDAGETCDGNCPTTCPPATDLCMAPGLQGDPTDCDVTCNAPITACDMVSDGCCPSGCTQTTDPDCDQDILVIGQSGSAGWLQDVVGNLSALGLFASVTGWDYPASGPPPLATLNNYDAVLAWTDGGVSTQPTFGNNLADYFDQGGRVVTATFAYCSNSTLAITGRWQTQGYTLLGAAQGQSSVNDSLGMVSEPNSMLMTGVTTLAAATAYRCPATPVAGAVMVAQWGSGDWLVVRGMVNGRNRVDLNLFPPSGTASPGFWTGNGAQLMANALLFQ